jgi:hypothetical protein
MRSTEHTHAGVAKAKHFLQRPTANSGAQSHPFCGNANKPPGLLKKGPNGRGLKSIDLDS